MVGRLKSYDVKCCKWIQLITNQLPSIEISPEWCQQHLPKGGTDLFQGAVSTPIEVGSWQLPRFRRFPTFQHHPRIWRFPEMGVPPDHPFLDGIFPYKGSNVFLGTPMTLETSIYHPISYWMIQDPKKKEAPSIYWSKTRTLSIDKARA